MACYKRHRETTGVARSICTGAAEIFRRPNGASAAELRPVHDRPYQVMVNATTGEVQGERPWSWVKIALAILCALAVAGIVGFFALQG
ncbi:MAG: hypothetical protein KY476_23745 [Planctomycetes bacterium]|nr:hypothetical protein [Planctomycetota bacterium]